MATRFWLDRLIRLARPMPPTPTPAMLSVSLGAVNPRPRTCRGTIAKPAVGRPTLLTNFRRDGSAGLLIALLVRLISILGCEYCGTRAYRRDPPAARCIPALRARSWAIHRT